MGVSIRRRILLLSFLVVLTVIASSEFLANYDASTDFFAEPTLEEIMHDRLLERRKQRRQEEEPLSREKRQTRRRGDGSRRTAATTTPATPPPVFPNISFRDMASIVAEAEKAVQERFDVLEPAIYQSDARQVRPHLFLHQLCSYLPYIRDMFVRDVLLGLPIYFTVYSRGWRINCTIYQ